MHSDRPGCLSGFLKLFLLDKLFDWLQSKFGFGRRSCGGIGCGIILLVILIVVACLIITNTD
jgi:hypothetical protein